MGKITNSKFNRQLKNLLYFFLICLGLFLLYLPKNYFDSGKPMCLSVLLFDRNCYGCGMTRGIQHLIHFDFKTAYDFNKLSFIVFPLFVFMIVKDAIKTNKKADD